jgi:hypothetical protein
LAIFAGIDFFRIHPIIMNKIDAIAAARNMRLNALLDGTDEHSCSLQIVI